MKIDEAHPLNQGVLGYIVRAKRQRSAPILAAWDSVPDPYMEQGSHPDVVERVWDVIGTSLPDDCRCLVYGTPALLHPGKGIILAFCNGTSYCLRLNAQLVEKAVASGAKTHQQWSTGGGMDSQGELGPDWVFGGWLADEIEWCRIVYNEIGALEI